MKISLHSTVNSHEEAEMACNQKSLGSTDTQHRAPYVGTECAGLIQQEDESIATTPPLDKTWSLNITL